MKNLKICAMRLLSLMHIALVLICFLLSEEVEAKSRRSGGYYKKTYYKSRSRRSSYGGYRYGSYRYGYYYGHGGGGGGFIGFCCLVCLYCVPLFVFPVVRLWLEVSFQVFDSHPFLSGIHFVCYRPDNIILFVFLFAFSEFLCELLEPCYVPLDQRCFPVVQNLLGLR